MRLGLRPRLPVTAALLLMIGWPLCATAQDPPPGFELALHAAWGGGPGELAQDVPEEGAPEGPMSFAVDATGAIAVLDQLSQRVLFYSPEGVWLRDVPIPATTYQDVALGQHGEIVLLDRLVRAEVVVLSAAGDLMLSEPLVGEHIAEAGLCTRLMLRPDGVWVEFDHRVSVRVLDASLAPVAERLRVAGRPDHSAKGTTSARLERPSRVELAKTNRTKDVLTAYAELTFEEPVWAISALEDDGDDTVMLAVQTLREEPETLAVARETMEVVLLDRQLHTLHRATSAVGGGALEQFRTFTLGADGAVYQMIFLSHGVEIWRWRP